MAARKPASDTAWERVNGLRAIDIVTTSGDRYTIDGPVWARRDRDIDSFVYILKTGECVRVMIQNVAMTIQYPTDTKACMEQVEKTPTWSSRVVGDKR